MKGDRDAVMMYRLFFDHHIMPATFYAMTEGEKTVIQALYGHRSRMRWILED